MTTKYTPGPWAVHYHEDSDSYTIHVAGRNWDGWDVAHIHCTKEDSANARLIAAAPELLEALEGVMKWWLGPSSADDGEDCMTADLFDNAYAAIAKAKGETQ